MAKRRVVVTGAAGYLVSRMLDELRARYDLVLLDVTKETRDGVEIPEIRIVDLTGVDRDQYREHFRGADAVIHCAFIGMRGYAPGNAPATGSVKFQNEMLNVQMAYNVYQTAVEEGVRRVVSYSSNHAADWYERLIWADKWDYVDEKMKNYADNYYGWAKEAYEDLGFVFATGRENDGKRLENVQLRIGGPRETDIDHTNAEDLKRVHRALGAYLSARDQTQLTVKSIETEDIRDEYGIPFQIFYGVSDNDHNFWSIANARKVIGYAPEDNSAVRFADKVAAIMLEAKRAQYG
jgi:hypothetical protein